MHYYIDGYNLLFSISSSTDSLQEQRERIVSELDILAETLNLRVTLVFDSKSREEGAFRRFFNNIEIFFTNQNESADEFIIEFVKYHKNPKRIIVVTSDRELAQHVKFHKGQTQDIRYFTSMMRGRYHNRVRKKKKRSFPSCIIQKPENAHPVEFFEYYNTAFNRKLEKLSQPKSIKTNLASWLEKFENEEKN